MNPRVKLVLMTAALLTVIVSGTGMAHPKARQQRTAQTDAKKSDPSVAAGRKASPASGCSLLTPAMIKKVLGDSFRSNAPRKAMPWYGGAWGWSCQYSSVDQRDAKIDFVVYAEASPTKAKQDFDKYSIAADSSKGNPSIGDSAYWVTPTKKEPLIYVLKGKVRFSLGIIPANEKQLKDLAAAVAAGI